MGPFLNSNITGNPAPFDLAGDKMDSPLAPLDPEENIPKSHYNLISGNILVSVGLALNAAALVFISMARSLKKTLKILIKSQVLSDILLMLMFLIIVNFNLLERLDSVFCYPVLIVMNAMITTSYFTISLFAVLNFISVVRPRVFRNWLTSRKVLMLVIGVWIVSLLLSIGVYGLNLNGGYCVGLFYIKQYGFLLLGLIWLFNSVSVVLFNSLTVNLLRRSRKPTPSENVQEPKETNRKTRASLARNNGGPFSKTETFSVSVRLRYCNAFCSKTYGNSLNDVSRKYLAPGEMSESQFHLAGDRQHRCSRHNTETKQHEAVLDRTPEAISLPFSQSDCKSANNFEMQAHSSTLKYQKRRRGRGEVKLSRKVCPQNKETIEKTNVSAKIQNRRHNDQSSSISPKTEQPIILSPVEFIQNEIDNSDSTSSSSICHGRRVFEEAETCFDSPPTIKLPISKQFALRRHSEPALCECSIFMGSKFQSDQSKRFSRNIECRSKGADSRILSHSAQGVNNLSNPHNKKKVKIILTLMILSMWSLAFNLPTTIYMMWQYVQPSDPSAYSSAAPRSTISMIALGCLGNTFLYVWRFVDFKFIKYKIRTLFACPLRF